MGACWFLDAATQHGPVGGTVLGQRPGHGSHLFSPISCPYRDTPTHLDRHFP